MQSGGVRGSDDRVARGIGSKARDVLGDSAFEQFDVLGQITDMCAEISGSPLVERRAVDPNRAAVLGDGQPDANQGARQCGLAGGTRADHTEPLSGLQFEGYTAQYRLWLSRSSDGEPLDGDGGLRGWQRHLVLLGRQPAQQFVEPLVALPRAKKPAPIRDREFDRSQSSGRQDRRCNHDAAGRLAHHCKIGAKPEHARLENHADHTGDGGDAADQIASDQLIMLMQGAEPRPGLAELRGQAHGSRQLRCCAGLLLQRRSRPTNSCWPTGWAAAREPPSNW